MRATLTSKGQITIPVEIRRSLGLKPGDEVDFMAEGKRAVLQRAGRLSELFGILGSPPSGKVITVEEMNEAIADAACERYARSSNKTPRSTRKRKK